MVNQKIYSFCLQTSTVQNEDYDDSTGFDSYGLDKENDAGETLNG